MIDRDELPRNAAVIVAALAAALATVVGCGSGSEQIPASEQTAEQTQDEINYPFGGAPENADVDPSAPPK